MTDFSVPQRMSASALFIFFIKILKSILSASVVLIFINLFGADVDFTSWSTWLRILASLGACIAISLLLAFAAYYPKKFYVKDGSLIFCHGILSRETTSIPLDRVHSLRTRQGVWYRIVKMRGIVFDTLASRTAEIELVLDESDWQALLHLIENEERPQPVNTVETHENNTKSVREFNNESLFLDALCQNHLKGMAVLGGFLAVVIDRINDFYYDAADKITDYTVSRIDGFVFSPLHILLLLVIIYVVVLLLWLGKVFLRYYDMSLSYDTKLLSFTHGLLSRSSSRITFGKVCTIWVKRNIFEKRLGLCTLRLMQALNVTAEKEEDNLKIYGADTSDFFLKWWLGDNYSAEDEITVAKSGRGVLLHAITVDLVLTIMAVIALCHFQLYLWLAVPALYLSISLLKGYCAMVRSKITLLRSYMVVSNGRFADIENYIKYSNIEVVRIKRSPLTRLTRRVTLMVATPGSSFYVRSLDEDEATRIYEFILFESENYSGPDDNNHQS